MTMTGRSDVKFNRPKLMFVKVTSGNRQMAKSSLLKEFFLFVKQEKKWWLIPLVLVLLVVGALIVFSASSPLAPFLYPLF